MHRTKVKINRRLYLMNLKSLEGNIQAFYCLSFVLCRPKMNEVYIRF
ncbi:hypothetical protein [Priestia endophytica]|nr:hypothetical protein [Priestia endophytica]